MRKGRVQAAITAVFMALVAGSMGAAQGQLTPVISVNDRVITQYELTQRTRLLELFGTPGDLNEAARNALIEDRLKRQEMDRFGISVSEEALRQELEAFAARADMNLAQFTQMLAQNNVDISTLRDFVEIGVLWRDFIRGRFGRQINVTDADIERAIAQRGAAPTQLEILLSEIIIAAPPDRAERARTAADQIAQMRSFAEFEAAARQVSALPSREDGGRLDWLPLENYPPQLRDLILDLEPGQVTDPIDIPNGIALFQLRGKREATRATRGPLSIEYAAYYIPGGRTETGLRTAAQVRDQVDNCDDLYGVARNQPVEVLDRLTEAPAAISRDVALELARLDPGEVSYNLTRDQGETLVFLMLCGRNDAGGSSANPGVLRNQIRSQRLAAFADALLEDLRAAAIIRP